MGSFGSSKGAKGRRDSNALATEPPPGSLADWQAGEWVIAPGIPLVLNTLNKFKRHAWSPQKSIKQSEFHSVGFATLGTPVHDLNNRSTIKSGWVGWRHASIGERKSDSQIHP